MHSLHPVLPDLQLHSSHPIPSWQHLLLPWPDLLLPYSHLLDYYYSLAEPYSKPPVSGYRLSQQHSSQPLQPEPSSQPLPSGLLFLLLPLLQPGPVPVERLLQLNKPAYDFYLEHGVDLKNEMLEIRISAQHNNGGLLVDAHWQTNIRGIYAVGEVSCTHGVRRPGGSALNAGQCGATRAAEAIAFSGLSGRNAAGAGTSAVTAADLDADRTLVSRAEEFLQSLRFSPEDRIAELFTAAAARMSAAGGMIRNAVKISEALEETDALLQHYFEAVHPSGVRRLGAYYRLYDVLTAQKVYLSAMQDYILHGSGSRGSALYTAPGGVQPHPALSETYRYEADAGRSGHLTQETWLQGSECVTRWRPVHKVPDAGLFFEAEWKKFRERRGL